MPRRVRLPGSGTTALMLVSPLEIVVAPLKKPVPVLIVNVTVAPLTILPLNQIPVTEPDSV